MWCGYFVHVGFHEQTTRQFSTLQLLVLHTQGLACTAMSRLTRLGVRKGESASLAEYFFQVI